MLDLVPLALKDLRRLDYLVTQAKFIERYNKLEGKQKDAIDDLIKNCNIDKLRTWLAIGHLELEDLPALKLMQMARDNYVYNYSRLLKFELVTILRNLKVSVDYTIPKATKTRIKINEITNGNSGGDETILTTCKINN